MRGQARLWVVSQRGRKYLKAKVSQVKSISSRKYLKSKVSQVESTTSWSRKYQLKISVLCKVQSGLLAVQRYIGHSLAWSGRSNINFSLQTLLDSRLASDKNLGDPELKSFTTWEIAPENIEGFISFTWFMIIDHPFDEFSPTRTGEAGRWAFLYFYHDLFLLVSLNSFLRVWSWGIVFE